MQKAQNHKIGWQEFRSSARYLDKRAVLNGTKGGLLSVFRFIIIVGISYVILAPVIGIVSNSFFSRQFHQSHGVHHSHQPTLEDTKWQSNIWITCPSWAGRSCIGGRHADQLLICSMVGYGFARYQFPLKKLLFGFVVVMIVVPLNTIQFPLYMTFRYFGVGEHTANLLKTPWPTVILSAFGCGLRSGLYIYIFNQFFRGLPKEIEEAALVDGAGSWYTYFIMLPNATPAMITVAVFSIVWQYNDSFFANTFNIPDSILITRKLDSLINVISNAEKIRTIREQQLYFDAGVVLVLLPVVVIYLLLQRRVIEGVERSGIVG